MADIAVTADPELRRLVNKVFAGTGLRRQELKDLVFHSLRGIALSHVMVGTLPAGSARGQEVHSPSQRKLMARRSACSSNRNAAPVGSGRPRPGATRLVTVYLVRWRPLPCKSNRAGTCCC